MDFERAQRRALAAALARFGLALSASVLAQYRRINDELWEQYRRGRIGSSVLARERFRRLLAQLDADQRYAPALSESFLDALSARGDLLPGCRGTLRRLGRRFRLGVVTNGIDRVQHARLRASRLSGHFETVVTSEACGFAKPDPRILEAALDALKLGPREATYVGDDLAVDGAAARAAGVPFVWLDQGRPLPRGLRRPRRAARRLAELEGLLV
jgi:2-haloacid dehalogenase